MAVTKLIKTFKKQVAPAANLNKLNQNNLRLDYLHQLKVKSTLNISFLFSYFTYFYNYNFSITQSKNNKFTWNAYKSVVKQQDNENYWISKLIKNKKNLMFKKTMFKNVKNSSKLLLYFYFKHIEVSKIKNEVQTLFLLGSNKQQYFLNTIGVTYPYFNFYSSGRCLRKEFGTKVLKGLKKSYKLNKALVEYYYRSSLPIKLTYTHTYIRPFNKRALILFEQIQTNSEYYQTQLGFHKYYKINFKRARRIKKRIKKKLVSENFSFSPYNKPL